MTILEAIKARHSVRKYIDKPIEAEKASTLQAAIEKINASSGLNIQLVLGESRAFNTGVWKYGQFSGVNNYFAMAGPKGREAEEKIGYYGEELVLLAQTLGLNTCWVGLTYKRIPGAYTLREDDTLHCLIALGYGANQGVQHPIKPMEDFYKADGDIPEWFRAGMEAALLAPTAVNQQKFRFILREDGKVESHSLFSMAGYTNIDMGIVKYHFEVGAGDCGFEWV